MKKCDICKKSDAVMKVRRVEQDGTTAELEVCAACAAARGFSEAEKVKLDVAQVLAEMKTGRVGAEDRQLACPQCGLTFAQFKRAGRLGCAGCYEAFREKIEPMLRRLHSAVQHVGKTAGAGRTEAQQKLSARRLTADLAQAVADEDYERAATIRDQLNRAQHDV